MAGPFEVGMFEIRAWISLKLGVFSFCRYNPNFWKGFKEDSSEKEDKKKKASKKVVVNVEEQVSNM